MPAPDTKAFLKPAAHQAAQMVIAAIACAGFGWLAHTLLATKAEAAMPSIAEERLRNIEIIVNSMDRRLGSMDRRLTVVQTQLDERTRPASHGRD